MSPTHIRPKCTRDEFQDSTAPTPNKARRGLYMASPDETSNAVMDSRAMLKKKRPHHKVTTGCIDCKAMRIKCDEAKPRCRRCTRVGRQCRGYISRKAWIFEPGNGSKGCLSSVSPTVAMPSDGLGTGSERRSLQFFCDLIVPSMATWQFTRSAQDFWLHYVRQSIQSTKVVRLLAIALASRLEDSMAPEDCRSRGSCQQYINGLSALTRVEEPINTETTLLCSQMIAIYEYLNPINTAPEGLSHFTATLRILVSLRPGYSSPSVVYPSSRGRLRTLTSTTLYLPTKIQVLTFHSFAETPKYQTKSDRYSCVISRTST